MADEYHPDSLHALHVKIDRIMEFVDKNLHISSIHHDLYSKRSARPYYPLNDGWALTTLDSGQPFFVNTEDRNVAPWIIMGGHWETNVERVMMSYVSPGMTALDIGAHFGYYTVKIGSKIGSSGRLYSFEPNPEVNAMCLENIKINGLASHVTLHKFALGDSEASALLTRSHSNMASANLIGEQDPDYSVEVQVKRLDDVIPADCSVDLIKLDAEGYEKRILDGAAATLLRSPQCAIMIELGLDRWEKAAPLSDLVAACGGNRELYAVQGDGTIKRIALNELRPFLLSCPFHENYIFVARRQDVETKIGHLLLN
ncbi:hypothetical protein R69746_08323 [Paraburkholderia aspalathi]|uniref:FkbM family methyltransferase n=1 Tax=Paraburkholderia aspalathi TaxID=1324617 RepID=UPI00190CA18F|nr:FkbM family methyltransferase [Paraburkholderia aspalathi]MBK3844237.1 FkbM family methyltransferase [Paraburkholderia aspalathi]CAE6869656.1 hypothetical protein R69746_08323 [Paraburkholderia aspalathi]